MKEFFMKLNDPVDCICISAITYWTEFQHEKGNDLFYIEPFFDASHIPPWVNEAVFGVTEVEEK